MWRQNNKNKAAALSIGGSALYLGEKKITLGVAICLIIAQTAKAQDIPAGADPERGRKLFVDTGCFLRIEYQIFSLESAEFSS